jgi:hypothetical protein
MTKVIISAIMLLVTSAGSFGQWYSKKYLVDDINMLTKEELGESLDKSQNNLFISAGIGVLGGLLIWLGNSTLKNGLDENATVIEEIAGSELTGKGYIVLGIGCATGGTIASLVYFGRFERIRSVLKNNYGLQESFKISPAVIFYGNNQSPAMGISVRLKF